MGYEEYWNNRYSSGGNSGDGSYGEELQNKLSLLKDLDIASITEVGCGDFNFGSHLLEMYPEVKYIGYDISDVIITQNQARYPRVTFTTDASEVLPADLVLCVDVFFHVLTDEELNRLFTLLNSLHTKYLAVTAYEHNLDAGLSSHVRLKKFNYNLFGYPIKREIVEEGETPKYFYLYKKGEAIDLSKVSACLNTKEMVYPREVLESVSRYPFGEILIKTGSDSPYGKYEMFEKAKYDMIFYQDDDAIIDMETLINNSRTDLINVGMKQSHFESYKDWRMTQGFGWVAFFPKRILNELKKYSDLYGEDEVFKRDTEKLLTHLVYPQNRVVIQVKDLPSAMNPDRISMQPGHYSYMEKIVQRCRDLI